MGVLGVVKICTKRVPSCRVSLNFKIQVFEILQKGSHDDFVIDPDSGKVSLLRELNYDRKNRYTLEVVAVDGGVPRSLSGTATLLIDVVNKNDKSPIFAPATQRAHITEDAEPGTRVIALTASDPDATSGISLTYQYKIKYDLKTNKR